MFEGRAIKLLNEIDLDATWSEAKDLLISKWDTSNKRRILRDRFLTCKRDYRESATAFLHRVQDLADRAFDDGAIASSYRDEQILRVFIRGQPERLANMLLQTDFANVESALRVVINQEEQQVSQKRNSGRSLSYRDDYTPRRERPRFRTRQLESFDDIDEDSAPEDVDIVADVMSIVSPDDDGHFEEGEAYNIIEVLTKTRPGLNSKEKCFFCQYSGHRWAKCFKLRDILEKHGMRRRPRPPRRPGDATVTSVPNSTPKATSAETTRDPLTPKQTPSN